MIFSCKLKLKLLIASNNYKGCGYSLINREAPTDERAEVHLFVCLHLSHVLYSANISWAIYFMDLSKF